LQCDTIEIEHPQEAGERGRRAGTRAEDYLFNGISKEIALNITYKLLYVTETA
jgi:hypothetical protein